MISKLLDLMIQDPFTHAKWLNTLSYMENCGARKIAHCEHPTKVKEEMLKHAAEEFRHAFYLKQQMHKLGLQKLDYFQTYHPHSLLGGFKTLRYLDRLELLICRYLREKGIFLPSQLKEFSYLLVTYAIEKRALHLYPLYQSHLEKNNSKVSIKSVLLEEKHHLEEIEDEIKAIKIDSWNPISLSLETDLFHSWLNNL